MFMTVALALMAIGALLTLLQVAAMMNQPIPSGGGGVGFTALIFLAGVVGVIGDLISRLF